MRVDLYLIEAAEVEAVDVAVGDVSADEVAAIRALSHEATRRDRLASYYLQRYALSRAAPGRAATCLRIERIYNKPHCPDLPTVHYNVSHARGVVALALACEPIGLDIEGVDARASRTVVHTLGEAFSHRSHLENTRTWTQMEAYLKRIGEGLRGLKQLRVQPEGIVDVDGLRQRFYDISPHLPDPMVGAINTATPITSLEVHRPSWSTIEDAFVA